MAADGSADTEDKESYVLVIPNAFPSCNPAIETLPVPCKSTAIPPPKWLSNGLHPVQRHLTLSLQQSGAYFLLSGS